MFKKNSQLGQKLNAKDLKTVKGGIICGEYIRRRCTYAYTNADACCTWALGQGADDFTFNPTNCQCCALLYMYNPCDGYLIP
jgi:hypothetical protein